jgi:hypothetical protein
MKTLSKFSGENMGGIATLWAIPPADIHSITKQAGNIYTVLFNTTDNIYAIYFTAETAKFREPKTEKSAGILYEPSFSAIIPKDTPTLQNEIDFIERHKWLIIYQDQNDYFKLIGTIREPLAFSADVDIPEDIKGLNKTMFVFSGKIPKRSLFINNPFNS